MLNGAWGDGRQETLFHADSLQRRFEVFDVSLHRVLAGVGEGTGARNQHPRQSGGALTRAGKAGGFVEVPGELRNIPSGYPRRVGPGRPHLQPTHSFLNIVGEARFAQLAIIDDVYARLDLLFNDFRDAALQASRQICLIVGLSGVLDRNDIPKAFEPGQTACVSCKDPIRAALHRSPLNDSISRIIKI